MRWGWLILTGWMLVAPLVARIPEDVVVAPDGIGFREVWAYLSVGEEAFWSPSFPITDLAYFSASVNSWGELTGLPSYAKIKAMTGRKHLVVAILDNGALSHMILHPEFSVRARLLDELVAAVQPYDGLQLDFETVNRRDKESFWSFLADLKRRLGDKILSVAIPARTSVIEDAYDYRVLDRTVDRIIVMAYDEHWSGSAPGPVSSQAWGRRVAQFAQSTVGPSRLVMGVPFYGRAWADKSLSRAYKAPALDRLRERDRATPVRRTGGDPEFSYDETVQVRVFFDDRESHEQRLLGYADLGVRQVAFWRLGQESPDFWSLLRLAPPTDP